MGFDTDLERAYDHDKLGFRYEALPCGDPFFEPARECKKSVEVEVDPAAAALSASPFENVWFSWNFAPQPISAHELEERKIYNTHDYSQSNRGHEFSRVLTDEERRALIEYLKTL